MKINPGCTARSLVERFENNYIPEPNTGCWLWVGNLCHGYGNMEIKFKRKVRTIIRAHRFSYEIYIGAIPKGMVVCHKCDVKCCVNPSHLFIGTQNDNMQDCIKKGRWAVGVKRGTAKLTEQQVIEIKKIIQMGNYTQKDLADQFKVNRATIYDIEKNRSWSWLK